MSVVRITSGVFAGSARRARCARHDAKRAAGAGRVSWQPEPAQVLVAVEPVIVQLREKIGLMQLLEVGERQLLARRTGGFSIAAGCRAGSMPPPQLASAAQHGDGQRHRTREAGRQRTAEGGLG
jgi:hypothetical protein